MSEHEAAKKSVDENWKAQVEREKAAVQSPADAGKVESPKADAAKAPAQASPRRGPIPPASFLELVEEYATQIMLALGAIPHPVTGKQMKDLELAKHYIDILAVLAEKTKGNLTPDEQRVLDAALYEMRMAFVKMKGT